MVHSFVVFSFFVFEGILGRGTLQVSAVGCVLAFCGALVFAFKAASSLVTSEDT